MIPALDAADAGVEVPPGTVAPPRVTTPVSTPPRKPSATSVIVLPSAKMCISRRRLTLHLKSPEGQRIRTVTIKVAGRTTHPRKTVITLVGLPKGRFTVTVTVKLSSGQSLTLTRRYKTCAPKRGR